MILHKYLDAKYGIDAILESQLKVSIPSELNDPFEMLPRDCGEWTLSKVKKYLKDKPRQNRMYQYQKSLGNFKNKKQFKEALKDINNISKNLLDKFKSRDFWDHIQATKTGNDEFMRVISFSSDYADDSDEILMWSHYSNKHKGIRLHYDSDNILVPSFDLKPINYSIERPPVDYTIEDPQNHILVNQLMNALVTKSSCWSYEKEYRIFIDPQYCSKIKIENKYLYFAKIPFNCLIRVDLGLYFDHKFIDDIQMLRNNDRFSNIEFFKAELDRNDYKLIYNKFS